MKQATGLVLLVFKKLKYSDFIKQAFFHKKKKKKKKK